MPDARTDPRAAEVNGEKRLAAWPSTESFMNIGSSISIRIVMGYA